MMMGTGPMNPAVSEPGAVQARRVWTWRHPPGVAGPKRRDMARGKPGRRPTVTGAAL